MTHPPKQVAVLTGDLIGSTEMSGDAVETSIDLIHHCAIEIGSWGTGYPPPFARSDSGQKPAFSRFRGDGWQFVLFRPERALRAALFIQAQSASPSPQVLRQPPAFASRISIGLGEMEPWSGHDLGTASGSAFVASGRGLDAMESDRRLVVAGPETTGLHRAVLRLLDDQLQGWSREQAEALSHYLAPERPTLKHIGQRLGISSQAVHARLKSAHAATLLQVIDDWESAA